MIIQGLLIKKTHLYFYQTSLTNQLAKQKISVKLRLEFYKCSLKSIVIKGKISLASQLAKNRQGPSPELSTPISHTKVTFDRLLSELGDRLTISKQLDGDVKSFTGSRLGVPNVPTKIALTWFSQIVFRSRLTAC